MTAFRIASAAYRTILITLALATAATADNYRHLSLTELQRLAERGDAPGLVHVFSAMESCSSYRPWHDKASGKTFFKPISGKCLHYYFYFIDAQFGLCYLRVPTWAPFRLQVYFNGHGWLARQLMQAGIAFETADNAFLQIADPVAA